MPKLLSRAALQKEYKKETDAAWDAMSKRFDRALAKRERGLEALRKAEYETATKPHREK